MNEGAEQTPLAVHPQITGRPDRRSAHVAGENGVLRRELVEQARKILRMDRLLALPLGRQLIETLACLPIMVERVLQVRIEVVLDELWEESTDRRLRISDEAVIDFRAPAQLFSADVDLDDRRVLGKELLIGEVGSDHQEHVAVHM